MYIFPSVCHGVLSLQVTKSMSGVVTGMDSILKSMNLEKVVRIKVYENYW